MSAQCLARGFWPVQPWTAAPVWHVGRGAAGVGLVPGRGLGLGNDQPAGDGHLPAGHYRVWVPQWAHPQPLPQMDLFKFLVLARAARRRRSTVHYTHQPGCDDC